MDPEMMAFLVSCCTTGIVTILISMLINNRNKSQKSQPDRPSGPVSISV